MQEVKVISAAEETSLLAEWFETVHWDKESEGIPELLPERDDEESRNRADAQSIVDWFQAPSGTPVPESEFGDYLVSENFEAWQFVDFSEIRMAPESAKEFMQGEGRFQQLYGIADRGNPNHSKKNGQFTAKAGGSSATPKESLVSTGSPVKGSDQSEWAFKQDHNLNEGATVTLGYGPTALSDPVPKPLVAIAKRQGFDGLPQKGSVDDAIAAGGLEIHRGIIPHEKSGTSAEKIRDDMTDGAYGPGKGNYGNGYYFSTAPGIAKMYANAPIVTGGYNAKPVEGGVTVRAALHKDAKIIGYNEAAAMHQEWYKSHRDKIDYDSYAHDFIVPEGMISPSAMDGVNDPGHFAALMGYDAIRVPLADRPTDKRNKARIKKKIGSDDLGDEIVVLNRTALVVDANGSY